MPVPPFSVDGIIPPYVGANGPGGAPHDMSPYRVSALDVAQALGTTSRRLAILKGWLDHRTAIRAAGFTNGFQWLDGSFVEDKVPNDLDIVTLFRRPAAFLHDPAAFIQAHEHLILRQPVKLAFQLDALWVDLDADADSLVTQVRYYFGLFSHRRMDHIWKGMLEVNLADGTDGAANALVAAGIANAAAAGGGP